MLLRNGCAFVSRLKICRVCLRLLLLLLVNFGLCINGILLRKILTMFILKYIGLLWNIIKENNDDECSEICHVGEPAGSHRLWYNSCHVEQVIP